LKFNHPELTGLPVSLPAELTASHISFLSEAPPAGAVGHVYYRCSRPSCSCRRRAHCLKAEIKVLSALARRANLTLTREQLLALG
jgi:hypothetical protein